MDWVINGCLVAFALASLLIIYSINYNKFIQQLVWFGLAFLVVFIFAQIDWRPLIVHRRVVFGVYLFSVLMLVVTFFFAPSIRGTRSWLVFGPVQLQTSELMKLGLIILFSYYFASRHVDIGHWQNLIIPLFYLMIPLILILLQPDMGAGLVLTSLWLSYLLISGIRWRHLAIGLLVVIVFFVWAWNGLLADYQKQRVIGLFHPNYDPLGVNYNVIQSKIAIGSAGILGKGFHQGTQAQLGFLPEATTDFLFAAFIEEWGLVGGLIILLAFICLLWRIIKIGLFAGNNFSQLLCLGTAVVLLVHFTFNVGSNLGLVPVIGVSFPFLSYGGSNLLTNAMLIGIIQSIVVRSPF
jgi:rod shape determining protein RodA